GFTPLRHVCPDTIAILCREVSLLNHLFKNLLLRSLCESPCKRNELQPRAFISTLCPREHLLSDRHSSRQVMSCSRFENLCESIHRDALSNQNRVTLKQGPCNGSIGTEPSDSALSHRINECVLDVMPVALLLTNGKPCEATMVEVIRERLP